MLTHRQSAVSRGSSALRTRARARLGVAWLNGSLGFAVRGAGESGPAWICPAPVSDPASLGAVLRDAVVRTQFTGRDVALVVAHPLLLQRRLDMPPMRGALRRRYLQRQAEQCYADSTDAHWACRPAVASSSAEAALMYAMPRPFYRSLVSACASAGLDLVVLLPFAELLIDATAEGNRPADEVFLSAYALPESVESVVVRGDGLPLLARSASADRRPEASRLAGDLHRTMQFIQQSFPRPVGSIHWLGSLEGDASKPASWMDSMGIEMVRGNMDGIGWARRTAALASGHPANLVAREQKEASGRRLMGSVHQVLSVACLGAATLFCLYSESVRRREHGVFLRLQQEVIRLRERDSQLKSRVEAIAEKNQFLAAAGTTPTPAVPLWFLGYVCGTISADLRLTNVVIETAGTGWFFRMAGRPRADVANTSGGVFALSNAIASAPFFARCANAPEDAAPNAMRARRLAHLGESSSPLKPASREFLIQGSLP